MRVSISKWGNSQGLRFPKNIMKDLNLSIGDEVELSIENEKVIIEPIKQKRKKYKIDDLVKKLPKDYKPSEEFSDKSGMELW